jgi:hypothetical protein
MWLTVTAVTHRIGMPRSNDGRNAAPRDAGTLTHGRSRRSIHRVAPISFLEEH